MAEYVNRQSGQVESLVRDCGFDSHLGYCKVPWSSGDDSWPTSRQRWFESIRDHSGLLVQQEGAGSARRK